MAHASSKRRTSTTATFSLLRGHVVLPSTLGYKERIELRQKEGFEYSRIYRHSTMRGMTVYDRLTADADVRTSLRALKASSVQQDAGSFAASAAAAAREVAAFRAAGMCKGSSSSSTGGGNSRRKKTTSGFVSNNNPHLTTKQQEADASCAVTPPLSALHPITLRCYFKKYPLEFMAAARPAARTTNETLRMMGAYPGDDGVARRLGLHVPPGSGVEATLSPAAAAAGSARRRRGQQRSGSGSGGGEAAAAGDGAAQQ